MRFKKSIKILIAATTLVILGLFVTKSLLWSNKFLYHKISILNRYILLVEQPFINLSGLWYSNTNDSISYIQPELNDKNWKTERFLHIALYKNMMGTTWFRKHFMVPDSIPGDTLILRLGLINPKAQVYLNGIKVADSCFIIFSSVCCLLPATYLHKGTSNLIAIRAQSSLAGNTNQISQFRNEIICQLRTTINLKGTWDFSTGDTMKWKEKTCNSASFKTIVVPKNWEDQGYAKYDGFAWYRKKFVCPAEMRNKTLLFVAGKIDDFNEVYINGEKIGGQIEFKDKKGIGRTWKLWNFYSFPGEILTDTNTVAVRVLDIGGNGGMYQGPYGIMTMEDYLKFCKIK